LCSSSSSNDVGVARCGLLALAISMLCKQPQQSGVADTDLQTYRHACRPQLTHDILPKLVNFVRGRFGSNYHNLAPHSVVVSLLSLAPRAKGFPTQPGHKTNGVIVIMRGTP
jgi:hypothetical protein